MKIGLLIEGACPGVNKFIHRLAESSQYDVIGFSRGWEGLYHDESVSVNTQMTSRFENLGGSVLSSSSVENIPKNFKYRMMQNLLKHDIDLLIIVGNEGSLQIANDLFSAGVRTVMIPSADFGLNVESYKMGLDTVAYELSECIHHLEKLSRNSNRKIVLSVSSRFKTLVEKMLQVHDFAWSVFCDRILISLDGSFENYDCSVKIDGVLTASKPLEKDLCFAHSLAEAVVSAWPLRGGSLVVYNGGFEFLPFQRFQKELALSSHEGG
ncbi:MAG TPA: 6-phosphofructokinase [Pseudothermotoga sp.]|nr:6-phosphofructokinase [Pseudothermotoga sp.]HOK83140.1 6-phosphofructokinase [Pseudothermotoga sp.]HPP69689.1 6-phosphofructokinase [Pseudothermotoga sp.]